MSVLAEWISMLGNWLRGNLALTTVMLVVSLVVLVGSLWLCHYVLTTIPSDYFKQTRKPFEQWRTSRPALWWMLVIGKNLMGSLLIVAGLVMFFTPGQGILTLLLGISLVDIPGKRKVERRIIQHPSVLKGVNRLRARAKQPPLELS